MSTVYQDYMSLRPSHASIIMHDCHASASLEGSPRFVARTEKLDGPSLGSQPWP